jgi:hypothetical protein
VSTAWKGALSNRSNQKQALGMRQQQIVPECPHHLMQRAVRRWMFLFSADDGQAYRNLLEQQLIGSSLRR